VAVVARDSLGTGVPGVTVGWRPVSGGAAEAITAVTDEHGIARARWTLGIQPGKDTLLASASGLATVTFEASALPIIHAIDSLPFYAGQTLLIKGRGLAEAEVEIAGRAAAVLRSRHDSVRVSVPDGLPACTGATFPVPLSIRTRGVGIDTSVTSLGSPLAGPTRPGEHLVSAAAVATGCPVRVAAGSYAVAVYTMAPSANPMERQYDDRLLAYALTVRPPGPPRRATTLRLVPALAAPAVRAAAAGTLREVRAPTTGSAAVVSCQREPLRAGQVVQVRDFVDHVNGTWGNVAMRVAKVSAHFQILVPAAVLDTMSTGNAARVGSLADSAEAKVYPFLRDLFGTLPDYDGTGRLTVLMNNGNFYGGWERFADGNSCTLGNFVNISPPQDWGLTTSWHPSAPFGILQTLVHEATHWVERDDARTVPYWGVEGLANLSGFLWWYRQLGRDLWTG
jgi:hypothetical protein